MRLLLQLAQIISLLYDSLCSTVYGLDKDFCIQKNLSKDHLLPPPPNPPAKRHQLWFWHLIRSPHCVWRFSGH